MNAVRPHNFYLTDKRSIPPFQWANAILFTLNKQTSKQHLKLTAADTLAWHVLWPVFYVCILQVICKKAFMVLEKIWKKNPEYIDFKEFLEGLILSEIL